MAKVFTIDIPYKSASYSALVTVRSREKEHSVHVHFFDDSIIQYVPGGELYFVVGSLARTQASTGLVRDKELYRTIHETVISRLKADTVL